MQNISEKFIHFIWRNKLFSENSLNYMGDEPLSILQTGTYNTDSGPDFFNARIKIGTTIWAGNIEIHLKSSDWIKHGHHKNIAYDSVILQVVLENDMQIFRTNGEIVPTVVLIPDSSLLLKYKQLTTSTEDIPCIDEIKTIDSFHLRSWFSALWSERMEQKTENIHRILEYTKSNWEEAFYISLARSFGSDVNAEPFELLAKSLPSVILAKHKQNIFQLEALLFGQAGMLDDYCSDDYFLNLQNEYRFLQTKYQLKPMDAHLWKFMRLRPPNFPTIRISQFAHLVHKSSHLFSKLIEDETITSMSEKFETQAGTYWNTHFRFGTSSGERIKSFGKTSIQVILINTVIPVLFLYGKKRDNQTLADRAINFAEALAAEKNTVTEKWKKSGVECKSSFDSQALIQLYKNYCTTRRCAECRIGGILLSTKTGSK